MKQTKNKNKKKRASPTRGIRGGERVVVNPTLTEADIEKAVKSTGDLKTAKQLFAAETTTKAPTKKPGQKAKPKVRQGAGLGPVNQEAEITAGADKQKKQQTSLNKADTKRLEKIAKQTEKSKKVAAQALVKDPPFIFKDLSQQETASIIKNQSGSDEFNLQKARHDTAQLLKKQEVFRQKAVQQLQRELAKNPGKQTAGIISRNVLDAKGNTVHEFSVIDDEKNNKFSFQQTKRPVTVHVDAATGNELTFAEIIKRRKEGKKGQKIAFRDRPGVKKFKRFGKIALRSLSPLELVKPKTASSNAFVSVAREFRTFFLRRQPKGNNKEASLQKQREFRKKRLIRLAKFTPIKLGIVFAGLGATKVIAKKFLPQDAQPNPGRLGKVTPGTIVAERISAVKSFNGKAVIQKRQRDKIGNNIDGKLGIKTTPGRPPIRFRALRKKVKRFFKAKRIRGPQTTAARQDAAAKAWRTRRRLYGRDGLK